MLLAFVIGIGFVNSGLDSMGLMAWCLTRCQGLVPVDIHSIKQYSFDIQSNLCSNYTHFAKS